MYTFSNLNDYEFESLSKDILEVYLSERLRIFAKGKDKGIDMCNDDKSIVGQSKHYVFSTTTSVVNSIKSEYKKVEVLNPKQYYVITSRNLTDNNIEEIYKVYANYMDSKNNVIDGVRINELLSKPDYLGLELKHYKLWVASTNVLEKLFNKDVFIDTEVLLHDIKNEFKYFVETQKYKECVSKLENSNLLIIYGNPGVGKTTISKMLILKYASMGYRVRYASGNDISKLKNSISSVPDKKEIILLDDFLGTNFLDLRSKELSEIQSLIGYVRLNQEKILILNSRISIFNAASSKQAFGDFMDKLNYSKLIIDMDETGNDDKALILYNHFYFNEMPKDYFDFIVKDKKYLDIIKHKNYNPRIIEYVTRANFYQKYEVEEYVNEIMAKMTNPKDVWHEEFTDRLSENDRILLYCLVSLGGVYIPAQSLKEVFYFTLTNIGRVVTTDLYEQSLNVLSENMIKLIDLNGFGYYSVFNPSISDYVQAIIKENSGVENLIVDNLYNYRQIRQLRLLGIQSINDKIVKLILRGEFLRISSGEIRNDYLNEILELNVQDSSIENNVISCLSVKYSSSHNFDPIIKFMRSEISEFYSNITSIFDDIDVVKNMIDVMKISQLKEIERFISKEMLDMVRLSFGSDRHGNNLLDNKLLEKQYDETKVKIGEMIERKPYDFLEEIDYETTEDDFYEIIDDSVRGKIEDIVENYKLPFGIQDNIETAVDYLIEEIDYESLYGLYNEPDYEPDFDGRGDDFNEDLFIDNLFNGDYRN